MLPPCTVPDMDYLPHNNLFNDLFFITCEQNSYPKQVYTIIPPLAPHPVIVMVYARPQKGVQEYAYDNACDFHPLLFQETKSYVKT